MRACARACVCVCMNMAGFTVHKMLDNRYYSELLMDTQKPHIRQFAAESIGFLLRKVLITCYILQQLIIHKLLYSFRLEIMINYSIPCLC